MNHQSRLRPTGSILERAAEIFDFEAAFQRQPDREAPSAPPPSPDEPEAVEGFDAPASALVLAEPWTPPEPEPLLLATPEPSGERTATIDRALLREGGFIEADGPVSGLAEEFRILKRQLLLGTGGRAGIPDAKRQTILVCSAQPDEGKTFCAINLALSMAGEKDLEVLLIDGDFVNPSVPGLLGLPADPGLTDALADPGCDPNDFVIQTDIEGLSVLPAGKHANNITELLASERTSQVLDALTRQTRKRVLVFDSPPALVASPASVLASHAGQIMMVVRADRTTEADLREAVSLLSACDTINLLLNRASLAVSGRRFGSYYGHGE